MLRKYCPGWKYDLVSLFFWPRYLPCFGPLYCLSFINLRLWLPLLYLQAFLFYWMGYALQKGRPIIVWDKSNTLLAIKTAQTNKWDVNWIYRWGNKQVDIIINRFSFMFYLIYRLYTFYNISNQWWHTRVQYSNYHKCGSKENVYYICCQHTVRSSIIVICNDLPSYLIKIVLHCGKRLYLW